ncbi:MAG: endonuclease [Pseudomonadota bacterium]
MRVCSGLTVFVLALAVAVGEARAQADSMTFRQLVHELHREGHVPLSYSDTDEAMREIHADPNAPGNVLLYYTNRSRDADLWVSRDGRDGWNREHLWPQSRGMGGFPMKSDLHNLMPTDASVNQNRGNLNFDTGGAPEGEAADTFLDGDSFEPRDAVKGDTARALFYVDTRYEGGGDLDLRLVDGTTPTGSTTLGNLCTLLDWHLADPIDEVERERNRRIEAVQGNLNWFIEDEALGVQIYGAACPDVIDAADTDTVTESDTGIAAELGDPALRLGTWNIANLHHES